MNRFVLGVDGGGTKTLCIALAEDGTLVGRGEGGPANPYSYGMDRTWESITAAVRAALAQAQGQGSRQGLDQTPGQAARAEAICFGISGVERPRDVAEVQARAASAGWAPKVLVSNDAVIALAAGLRGRTGPGVVVIAGTGSIIFGMDAGGRSARAGGWGPVLGDEGSGYEIGRRGLIAVMRAYDWRGAATLLTELAQGELGYANPEELVPLAYGTKDKPALAKHAVARLSGLVFSAAGRGDAVANGILEEAARELALGVAAVSRRLGLAGQLPVVTAGGVFRVGGETFRSAFAQELSRLESQGLEAETVRPSLSPAVGAALRALAAAGVDPSAITIDPQLEGRDL